MSKKKKHVGTHAPIPLPSYREEGKHVSLVIAPTVEPYLFLDKCKESYGLNTALIGMALPQWECSCVAGRGYVAGRIQLDGINRA